MIGDIKMSLKELNQVEIIEKLDRREIKQKKAAEILNLSVRQVKRKLHNYRLHGAKSLIHKGREKSSNHQLDQVVIDKAINIIKEKYWDFGPTLACEKLIENHNIKISREKLRQEMIKVGLWKTKSRKKAQVHQLRERRSCFGELVQIDGSPHAWFEDRGPKCNLNVMIDDSTGIPVLEFSKSETTQAYFSILEKYLKIHGKPMAIYSDKHSIFTINNPLKLDLKKPSKETENDDLTQLSRALKQLDIKLILANTPQAKGRVERINQTLQDRLVKELRLKNISTIEQANQYLPEFTNKFIKRFSFVPKSKVNMHKKLTKNIDLSKILCIETVRILSKNLTFQHNNIIYQINTDKSAYTLRKTSVVIRKRYDKTITIWDHKGNKLDYSIIKKTVCKNIANSKELNQLVDEILVQQAQQDYQKRNPWESDWDELTADNACYKPIGAI